MRECPHGCLFLVVGFPRLALRDAGRPERSGGRLETRRASRTARPCALIRFQNSPPAPTPSRRHGWLAGGALGALVFTGLGFFAGCSFLTAPSGRSRHFSSLPRYTSCTRPLRS